MKTTVEIADPLFARAKAHCAEHNLTLRELLETALRQALDQQPHAKPFRLRTFGFDGQGAAVSDWNSVRDLIYEGRGSLPPGE